MHEVTSRFTDASDGHYAEDVELRSQKQVFDVSRTNLSVLLFVSFCGS